MNFVRKPIALALFVAATQIAGVVYAQPKNTSAAPLSQVAPAPSKAPIQPKAPDEWIVYDETTYTPVVDVVSQHLNEARKAFDAKDNKKAAAEMRAVAAELRQQAARADKTLLASDTKTAKGIQKRMIDSAQKVDSAAEGIENGKINSTVELDKVIDSAARADIGHRWLISDVATWYPVIEQPQRHFTDAAMDYAKKDYKATAIDIRKAISYLRLEAGRAKGDTKLELDSAVTHLDTLAASLDRGALKDEQSLTKAFAQANHALALEHRAKAVESWTHKEYDKAGYELKAAAHGLESAAGWVGVEAKAGATDVVADTHALANKLVSGAHWTREEVAKVIERLGNGINALGQKIGGVKQAAPVKKG